MTTYYAETVCQHGYVGRHTMLPKPKPTFTGWEWVKCPGGSRQELTHSDLVAIARVPTEWCEIHGVPKHPEAGAQCWYSVYDPDELGDPGDCRIVSRAVVSEGAE